MTPERPIEMQTEVMRRHRAAALTVRAFLAVTVLLSLFAFLARSHFRHDDNDSLDKALRIMILICGIGAVSLRRRKFAAARLHDIAARKGVAGLLATLVSTTLQVAFLGMALAVCGFIVTVMTGNEFYSYGAGLVGFVVLLYCYPTRNSWQQVVRNNS